MLNGTDAVAVDSTISGIRRFLKSLGIHSGEHVTLTFKARLKDGNIHGPAQAVLTAAQLTDPLALPSPAVFFGSSDTFLPASGSMPFSNLSR